MQEALFLIGLTFYHRCMSVCTSANSHTLTHTLSFGPTCVLLSFPDLFEESVGTSEALRECLEKRRQERGKVVFHSFGQMVILTERLSESTKCLAFNIRLAHMAFKGMN